MLYRRLLERALERCAGPQALRAFDPASASLYVLVAQGQSEQLSLAAVDATGTVRSHAHLHGDVGSSSEVLMAMAIG